MVAARQDAWNDEEDVILAEVVLRHIREGSTQLAAFEEVADRLSRTASACGFRWNSLIRKQYESAITMAKKQRKTMKKKEQDLPTSQQADAGESQITLADVIDYLQKFRLQNNRDQLLHINEQLKAEMETLKQKNEQLKQEVKEAKNENLTIQKDYKALLAIMERAREMTVFHDKEVSGKKSEKGKLQKSDQ